MRPSTLVLCVGTLAVAAATATALPAFSSGCNGEWCAAGNVDAPATVPVLLAIKLRNTELLEKTLLDVSDPDSPNYGKHLTRDAVQKMTANPVGVAAAKNWIESLAGSATEVSFTPGGGFARLRLPVDVAEKALGASYQWYVHASTGKRLPRSTRLDIPLMLKEHIDFIGDVMELPVSFGVVTSARGPEWDDAPVDDRTPTDDKQPTDDSTPSSDAKVTPAVLASLYGFDPTQCCNKSATAAVFEQGQDYAPADLSEFGSMYNLGDLKVAKVIGPNDPSQCKSNPNACGEADLDVQYLLGVAPGTELTFWAIDPNDQTPFLDWILKVDSAEDPPLIHSVSYGDVEAEDQTGVISRINQEFQKAGTRGLTIVIASGDDGVGNFPARSDSSKCGFNPAWPASSPWVTAVGATQFVDGQISKGETPCSTDNKPASLITTGGGFSNVNSMPSYQKSAVASYLSSATLPPESCQGGFPATGFCKTGRAYPDVAANGHNYQVVIGGQVIPVDGTSAAAPVTAGMLQLINSKRMDASKGPLGFVNPALYKAPSSSFTDITTGDNKCCGSPGQGGTQVCCPQGFHAASGYDPVSGLGTIVFGQLSSYLISLA